MPLKSPRPNRNKSYHTTRDITIPAGTKVVFITSMRQHVVDVAMAVVAVGKDMHFDWLMYADDALKEGLIEEIPPQAQAQTTPGGRPAAVSDHTD